MDVAAGRLLGWQALKAANNLRKLPQRRGAAGVSITPAYITAVVLAGGQATPCPVPGPFTSDSVVRRRAPIL